eukprot:1661203-Rhodomonas_salina.1
MSVPHVIALIRYASTARDLSSTEHDQLWSMRDVSTPRDQCPWTISILHVTSSSTLCQYRTRPGRVCTWRAVPARDHVLRHVLVLRLVCAWGGARKIAERRSEERERGARIRGWGERVERREREDGEREGEESEGGERKGGGRKEEGGRRRREGGRKKEKEEGGGRRECECIAMH